MNIYRLYSYSTRNTLILFIDFGFLFTVLSHLLYISKIKNIYLHNNISLMFGKIKDENRAKPILVKFSCLMENMILQIWYWFLHIRCLFYSLHATKLHEGVSTFSEVGMMVRFSQCEWLNQANNITYLPTMPSATPPNYVICIYFSVLINLIWT